MSLHSSTLPEKDFAPLDTQEFRVLEHRTETRRGMLLAVAMHVGFAVVAVAISVPLLMYLQLVSIGVYAVSYYLSFRGYDRLNITLAWIDLLGHATLAGWILGPESGFHYYSWILLPLLFTNPRRTLRWKVRFAVALCVFYLLIDWWLAQVTPLATVSEGALNAVRYFNMTCYLVAVTATSLAYTNSIMDAEQRLRQAADTDALTGLLNRRRMSDRMQQEWVRARSERRPVAVMLLDIDHFKAINDQYGHARGDEVIARVAGVLQRGVRRGDLVARWGGEEFLVLLPGAVLGEAHEVAERIRQEIAQLSLSMNVPMQVSATAGLAMWHEGESLDATIERADGLLYAGKRQGRNCVVTERESPDATAVSARLVG
jgi:diguanylate cyclase (GGDEF)-like protein